MAKSTSKSRKPQQEKKTTSPTPAAPPAADTMNRKDKIRIALGLVLFILGAFLTFAVIGYIYSWEKDQDLLVSARSFWGFLFDSTEPIANFCGRLGAISAHYLVYNGIGLPVLLVTFWITGVGYNLLVKKRIFPATQWLNIIALGFLFLSPILAFVFRRASFSYGGAFGNSLIEWTSGFAGNIGIILMTLFMMAFFYFIVFQLKLQPILNAVGKVMPERKERTQSGEETPAEDFKGFSNPAASPEELEQKEQVAASQGYDYQPAGAQDEMEEEDMELLDVLEEEGSLDFVVNEPEDAYTPALHVLNTRQQEPQEELAPVLHIREDKETEGDAPGPACSSRVPEEAVERTTPPVITFNAVAENGIVLEIPEREEEKPVIENDSAWEINIPEEPDASPGTAAEDVAFKINETVVEQEAALTGKQHFGIDTPYVPELDLKDYRFPSLDLLAEIDQSSVSVDRQELENNKNQIVNTLRSFGIEIQRISATVGPTVTLYEIVPAEGVRISKIKNLEDDIALNLAALGIRIIAPIPGRGTIGIEVPNTKKQIVSMRSLLASEKFQNSTMSLPVALGKKIDNENYIVDLATMPHLLMAGATGQGKSVGINTILVSLLYKKHPSELKFVMVDPKKVELSVYRLIERHYLAMLPDEEEAIITDTKKVVNTLNALCIEMDNRYELLKDAGARNIKEYNEKFKSRKLNPQNGHKYLPFIVLVIDEFADLIMTAGKEVEMPIARLAQLARAIGIHIIIATQRPSVNVITGIIKANFPARIAFRVSAKVDSRTILDAGGADQLIGRGDMLISIGSDLLRLQCAFVDTPEVERIVEFIGQQRGYPTAFLLPEYEGAENEGISKEDVDLSKRDKMFDEAARLVVSTQSGSTSMLQRKFNLGYNRAGRIMDQLEAADIVGPAQGSKPREVLVKTEYELEQLLNTLF